MRIPSSHRKRSLRLVQYGGVAICLAGGLVGCAMGSPAGDLQHAQSVHTFTPSPASSAAPMASPSAPGMIADPFPATTSSPPAAAATPAPAATAAPMASPSAAGPPVAAPCTDVRLCVSPTPAPFPSLKPLLSKTDTALRQSTSFEQTVKPRVEPTPKPNSKAFYFSYDDSASTSAVELTKNALKQNRLPSASWARPWEFLNFERFDNSGQEKLGLFKISMGIWQHPSLTTPTEKTYEFGVHLSAPDISIATRKPLNLTILLDLSGFYQPNTADPNQLENPIELMRTGLVQMADSLKPGDTVSIVQSAESPIVALENWAYQKENLFAFTSVARQRDVNSPGFLKNGIDAAYQQALKNYDPNKINRVLLMSDISAPDTRINLADMAKNTRINNQEGIYFSAIGLGSVSDKLLNNLTEAGSGAYFTVLTKTDAKHAFQERFIALMDIAAKQVTFRLDYPALLKRKQSAAEQSSVRQSEVLPTNFSYNTSQFFWETFASDKDVAGLFEEEVKLWIFYLDPQSREHKTEVYERTLGSLINAQLENIKDAHLIYLLTALMKGEMTPATVQTELDTLFVGHDTPLAKEYKQLIQTWSKLSVPGQ